MLYNPEDVAQPRASHIVVPGRADIVTELWMGGSHSPHGEPLRPDDLAGDWLIDLAGDLPAPYQTACALWLPCVFADQEEIPPVHSRLTALAGSIAACLCGAAAGDRWEHPATPPRRLYILCNQGLNRSGLLTGLILRALGVPADTALAVIAASRPGALTNRTFAGLVRAWAVGGRQ